MRLKNILNDLIDQTYPDSLSLKKYKGFFIEFKDEQMKSKHGDYNIATRTIRIFNLYRSDISVLCTTIHELAHHIDNMNRQTSNHDSEFYRVYKELLYTAINMGLFNKDDFLAATRDASDTNKVRAMIRDYVPQKNPYKKDTLLIEVAGGYDYRLFLKEEGYTYNATNKSWEKEIERKDLVSEEEVLKKLSEQLREVAAPLSYNVVDSKQIKFQSIIYLVAGEGSYDYRADLKAEGFRYVPEQKHWKKKFDKTEAGNLDGTLKEQYEQKYPSVHFYYAK